MVQLDWALQVLSSAAVCLVSWSDQASAAAINTRAWLEVSAPSSTSQVFRGDPRSPQSVRAVGGFLPNSVARPWAAHSYGIYKHVKEFFLDEQKTRKETIYVSTTSHFGTAGRFAMPKDTSKPGYIYHIQATRNMIDVQGSLLNHNVYPAEREFSAMGDILWEQIKGWVYQPPRFSTSWSLYPTLDGFERKYTANRDYNSTFDRYAASRGQPQLAGFFDRDSSYNQEEPWSLYQKSSTKDYALEFMHDHGAVVRWRGYFPLFDAKTRTKREDSGEARGESAFFNRTR